MNSEYCSSCGAKAYFEVSKPKFCPKCGIPFNRPANTVSAQMSKRSRFQEDDEEEVIDGLPRVNKSNAVIEVNIDTVKPMSLKDHWLNASPNEEKLVRDAPKNVAPVDKILEDVQSSCAQTRTTKEI